MEFHFSNGQLEKLYTTGSSKKNKIPKNVAEDFVWVVQIIEAAIDIHDFWKLPALNFEKLRGYERRYSFRLSKKYRLEVEILWTNEEQTVGIVEIDKISTHYQ